MATTTDSVSTGATLDSTQRTAPGLTAAYVGKYKPKSAEFGVQKFAYRTGVPSTAFQPGSAYSSYVAGTK